MSQSIASETRLPIGLTQGAGAAKRSARGGGGRTSLRRLVDVLADAVLLLLVVLLVPVAILVVGTPLALFVRLLIEIAKRM